MKINLTAIWLCSFLFASQCVVFPATNLSTNTLNLLKKTQHNSLSCEQLNTSTLVSQEFVDDNSLLNGNNQNASFLFNPIDVVIDQNGDLLIVDGGIVDGAPDLIRKLDIKTGMLSTIAGSGSGFSGDGDLATKASLNLTSIAVDSQNNIILVDILTNRVRKIDAKSGIISTIAGNGVADFSGDNDLAINATLDSPISVFVDSKDNIIVTDMGNNRIRKIDAQTKIISTIAGSGFSNFGGFSGDGGLATNAMLSSPVDAIVDSLGNLYISDRRNRRIRKVDVTGMINTIAGNGDFRPTGNGDLAINAGMEPGILAIRNDKTLFISSLIGGGFDDLSNTTELRQVNLDTGIINQTIKKTNSKKALGFAGGLSADTKNLFIADVTNRRILKIDSTTKRVSVVKIK